MLSTRILTALIGIPLAFFIINYGQWVFFLTVLILAFIAWHEYCVMVGRKQAKPSYGLGVISIGLLLGCSWLGNSYEMFSILFLSMLAVLIKMVLYNKTFTVGDAVYTVFGIAYIGLSFDHLVLLRFTDNSLFISTSLGTLSAGAAYLWLAIVGTWSSDTAAYFVGCQWGRHKLCPTISPNKTVEGFLGGVLGSIVAVTSLNSLFGFPILQGIIVGLLVGIIAPLGDLTESAIKRYTGVKDSGRILPGHGGILDRFDSIMFAVPAVYYYTYVAILR